VRASTKEKSMLRTDEENKLSIPSKLQKQKHKNKDVPKLIFNQKDLLLDALDTEVR